MRLRPDRRLNAWTLWALWSLATAAGMYASFGVMIVVRPSSLQDTMWTCMTIGALLSAPQWLVLSLVTRGSAAWIVVTAAAVPMGGAALWHSWAGIHLWPRYDQAVPLISIGILSLLVGAGQSILLRRATRRAWLWILVVPASLSSGFFVGELMWSLVGHGTWGRRVTLAAACLTFGTCNAIPIAMWFRPGAQGPEPPQEL